MLREQLAEEAARLIHDHGIQDYGLAKRKAAARLGVRTVGALPSNSEIESRVIERQRIFEPDEHTERVFELRQIAVELMQLLDEFQPRVAGSMLSGAVTISTGIELHLFTAAPEEVIYVLEAERFTLRNCQRRFRLNGQDAVVVPGFRFSAHGARVDAFTFPEKGIRQAPMSPIDGRPMRRADRAALLALVEAYSNA